jgi:hypothetical protein
MNTLNIPVSPVVVTTKPRMVIISCVIEPPLKDSLPDKTKRVNQLFLTT